MNSYENADIGELILLCRRRDEEAFAEIVRRYTPMMRKVVSRFKGHNLDLAELFEEGCVALYTAAIKYDLEQQDVTFGLYARICVHHRILDLLRYSKSQREIADCDVEDIADGDGIESGLVKRELIDTLIKSAGELLSDYEYKVFILHIQGYQTADIARSLSRSAKSVDNAKSRVFRRLRETFGGISDI